MPPSNSSDKHLQELPASEQLLDAARQQSPFAEVDGVIMDECREVSPLAAEILKHIREEAADPQSRISRILRARLIANRAAQRCVRLY